MSDANETPDRQVIGGVVVWHRPRVTLVARPMLTGQHSDHVQNRGNGGSLSRVTASDGESLCELAGRLCYDSFGKPRPGGSEAYHAHILASGHGSIYEHASYSFLISGVSRALTHELARHRAGTAISQLSQRYADQTPHGFVTPEGFAAWHEGDRLHWIDAREGDLERYGATYREQSPAGGGDTAAKKLARGRARMGLPECSATELVWTANVRALRHVIESRCSEAADWEIRRLFNAVHAIMLVECPLLFGDYSGETLPDGTLEITTSFKKV